MLILTRKVGESIIINNEIKIMVIAIVRFPGAEVQIKLGIDAPKYIPVHREEIQEKVNQDRCASKGYDCYVINEIV